MLSSQLLKMLRGDNGATVKQMHQQLAKQFKNVQYRQVADAMRNLVEHGLIYEHDTKHYRLIR